MRINGFSVQLYALVLYDPKMNMNYLQAVAEALPVNVLIATEYNGP
jgi:hypothetical protein